MAIRRISPIKLNRKTRGWKGLSANTLAPKRRIEEKLNQD